MIMSSKAFQNWLFHALYSMECENASHGKCVGMVTREEFVNNIQEFEEKNWEEMTDHEKEDFDPPHSKVQIAGAIKALKHRQLIKEYKNSKGEKCLRTL